MEVEVRAGRNRVQVTGGDGAVAAPSAVTLRDSQRQTNAVGQSAMGSG
jgi:hypothetical protein